MFHKCILTKDENSENLESWKKENLFQKLSKVPKVLSQKFLSQIKVYTMRGLIYTSLLFKNESVLCAQIYVPLGKKNNKNSPYGIWIVSLVMLPKS